MVLAFYVLNALHSGAIFTLGPTARQGTSIGETGRGPEFGRVSTGLSPQSR